jgi:hypothetical protein
MFLPISGKQAYKPNLNKEMIKITSSGQKQACTALQITLVREVSEIPKVGSFNWHL